MVKPIDEIARIIAQAERAAYQKGWNEALAHVVNIARNPMPPEQQQSLPLQAAGAPTSNGQPATMTMVQLVHDIIVQQPGLRGLDVVSAVQEQMPGRNRKSIDRTVRTAFLRLKKKRRIESISGKWYSSGDTIKAKDL